MWTAVKITVNLDFGAVTKVRAVEQNYSLGRHSELMQSLLWSCLKPPAGFAERAKKLSIAVLNGCIAFISSRLLVIAPAGTLVTRAYIKGSTYS